MPHEAATARMLQGVACQQAGDLDGAVASFDAARSAFERLGAQLDLRNLSDITAPTAFGDRYVTVQAAIGIAIYPTSGSNPEDLLVRAGDALASSMERPTNRFAFG